MKNKNKEDVQDTNNVEQGILKRRTLNEWMMTNQFYDILLSNGFYTDLEAYKADPANRPLIDENTGEWIEIPDISELL